VIARSTWLEVRDCALTWPKEATAMATLKHVVLNPMLCACIGCLLLIQPTAAAVVVEFPDPILEQLVREAINKPTGDILDTDLVGVGFTDLSAWGASDLTGLEYCLDLETLTVESLGITDIWPLASLANLRVLRILGADLWDFSPLAGLVGIEHLDIYNWHPLTDLSWAAGLTALQELLLSVYEDVDLAPLMGLTNLTYLTIGGEVSDISALAALTNLTRLALFGRVSDLGPVAGLTNLTSLTAGSLVSDLSPLAGLTNLESLYLGAENFWANRVTDIGVLAGLPNLRRVHLDNNSVSDVSALAGLTNLELVDLENNLVTDLGALAANPAFADCDVIARGNPLSQQALCVDVPALAARGVWVSVDGFCGGAGPAITKQPGGGPVEVGRPYTFTINATGTGFIGHQWRKDGYVLFPRRLDYLTLSSVSEEDAGWYSCLVTDDTGTTMSQAAYLNVVPEGAMPTAGPVALLILVAVLGAAGAAMRQGSRRAKPAN